jgi:hypothetical protein
MALKQHVKWMDRHEASRLGPAGRAGLSAPGGDAILLTAAALTREMGMAGNAATDMPRQFSLQSGENGPSAPLAAKIGEAWLQLVRGKRFGQSAESMLADSVAQCRTERRKWSGDPWSHTEGDVDFGKASQCPVRVAIYSDEPILATGFQSLIAADPELQLTACCETISQLKKQLADGSPDVAVVDFTEEITAVALAELRSLAVECKLILWTNSIEGELARRALKFGIRGVLRKTLPLEAYRQCLHTVNSGQLWFERQLPDRVN